MITRSDKLDALIMETIIGSGPELERYVYELHCLRDRNIARECMHLASDYTTFSLLTEMYNGPIINEW